MMILKPVQYYIRTGHALANMIKLENWRWET